MFILASYLCLGLFVYYYDDCVVVVYNFVQNGNLSTSGCYFLDLLYGISLHYVIGVVVIVVVAVCLFGALDYLAD